MASSWRSDHSQVGTWTHFLKQAYLVGTIGISALITHWYLTNKRSDLPVVQKKEFRLSYSLYALRSAFRFFYIQKERIIGNHELLISPLIIPITFFLPIYFANKAKIDTSIPELKEDEEDNEEGDTRKLESNIIHYLGIGLTVMGHIFSIVSEFQRRQFKLDKNNKGQLYTDGLNSLSRHPNYFGNILLYGGLSLFSRNIYMMLLPMITFAQYYYYHVPEIEEYLAKRYATQWPDYKERVKSLIPYVI